MGPINGEWIRENGEQWAGGRIDIRGGDLDVYGDEMPVPVMHGEDWVELDKFCQGLKTNGVLAPGAFWSRFETFLGREIRWFDNDSMVLDDGFGDLTVKCNPRCRMEIVRPGKTQCDLCDYTCSECGSEKTYSEHGKIQGWYCKNCESI